MGLFTLNFSCITRVASIADNRSNVSFRVSSIALFANQCSIVIFKKNNVYCEGITGTKTSREKFQEDKTWQWRKVLLLWVLVPLLELLLSPITDPMFLLPLPLSPFTIPPLPYKKIITNLINISCFVISKNLYTTLAMITIASAANYRSNDPSSVSTMAIFVTDRSNVI